MENKDKEELKKSLQNDPQMDEWKFISEKLKSKEEDKSKGKYYLYSCEWKQ